MASAYDKPKHKGKLINLPSPYEGAGKVGYGYGFKMKGQDIERLELEPLAQPVFWPLTNLACGFGRTTRELAIASLERHLNGSNSDK